MPSFNRVILMGNITREIEVKFTPKGTAVCDVGLAINRHYTTESGEKKEECTFVDCSLWGRVAEIVGQYCKKGDPLFIEGRLSLDQWTDKESGQKRSKLKVIGENIQLLGTKPASDQESPDDRAAARKPQAKPKPPADPDLDSEDEPEPY